MGRIERKLSEWREHGLLDAAQVARIEAHERSKQGGARWVVWAFAAVGALAVIAGIISLVAANWDDIPDGIKLGAGLVLLIAAMLGARAADHQGHDWIRDLALLLHQGLVLAMIGLVAQVYHLSGHPYRPFAAAFALAIPAALVGRRAILCDAAIYLGLQALWLWLVERELMEELWKHFRAPQLLVAIAALFIATAPYLRAETWARALHRWAFMLTGVSLMTAAFAWGDGKHFWVQPWMQPEWPLVLMLVALAAAGISRWRQHRRVEPAAFIAACIAATFVVSAAWVPPWSHLPQQAIGFAFFCAFCVAYTFAGAAAGSKQAVNAGSFALAVRIFVLFFELFSDLTDTGIGLIITGVLLVSIAYGWWRLRVLIPVPAEVRQ
ncbi:MAG: DUF2157 domain-containing protein [Deltaproteobacteria bacterium]|nr:DUF2157 domain-containing protein [Deltaproteobacteria bacterium]